jgi:hypothetical protein
MSKSRTMRRKSVKRRKNTLRRKSVKHRKNTLRRKSVKRRRRMRGGDNSLISQKNDETVNTYLNLQDTTGKSNVFCTVSNNTKVRLPANINHDHEFVKVDISFNLWVKSEHIQSWCWCARAEQELQYSVESFVHPETNANVFFNIPSGTKVKIKRENGMFCSEFTLVGFEIPLLVNKKHIKEPAAALTPAMFGVPDDSNHVVSSVLFEDNDAIPTDYRNNIPLVLLTKPVDLPELKMINASNSWIDGANRLEWRSSDIITEMNRAEMNKGGCMVVLPSQLNGAEHPNERDEAIPTVENWLDVYGGDPTGGPIGQLTGSHEVAQEIVRISEANASGRRPTKENVNKDLPINYLKHVFTKLPLEFQKMFRVNNGYFQCLTNMTTVGADELLNELNEMSLLMSLDNPVTGKNSNYHGKHPKDAPKVDMVYASAIPLGGKYPHLKTPPALVDKQEIIGLNIIYHQYRLALYQACHRSIYKNKSPTDRYLVLLMPLGGGVWKNPKGNILLAAQNAIEAVRVSETPGFDKLDIKMLFYKGNEEEIEYKKIKDNKNQLVLATNST